MSKDNRLIKGLDAGVQIALTWMIVSSLLNVSSDRTSDAHTLRILLFAWQLASLLLHAVIAPSRDERGIRLRAFFMIAIVSGAAALLTPLGIGLLLFWCMYACCHLLSLGYTLLSLALWLIAFQIRSPPPGSVSVSINGSEPSSDSRKP